MKPPIPWLLIIVIASLSFVPAASAQGTFFYVNTNSSDGNSVIAYSLRDDGSFNPFGTFATRGKGNDTGYFASNRVVVGGPDAHCLFATNDGSNTITAFSIDSRGRLSFTETVPTGGTSGFGISLAATSNGSWLYAASERSNSVVGFQIDPQGINSCSLAPLPFPPLPVQGPDGTKTTADSAYLFVASPTAGIWGSIYWFSIDPATGQLTPAPGSPRPVRSNGPNGVAAGVDINCSEDTVVVAESNPALLVDWFNFDPVTGSLTPGPDSPITGTSSSNTNVVQFSADDLNLFVVGTNSDNVSSFTTAPFTFQSTTTASGGGDPSGLAVDGTGTFAVTANSTSVSSYVRGLAGDLEMVQVVPTAAAASIAIKPPKCNN